MSLICEFLHLFGRDCYCGDSNCYCPCCDDADDPAPECFCDCDCGRCCDPDAPEYYHCEGCDCGDCSDDDDGPFTFVCECYGCQKQRHDAYLADLERQRRAQAEEPLRERLRMQEELLRMIETARQRFSNGGRQ